MNRPVRQPSCPIAARAVAALVVLALVVVAQVVHLPAAHGHDANAAQAMHGMDTLADSTSLPVADAPQALHNAADCTGPGCGACVAVFAAPSGVPDRVREAIHRAPSFGTTVQPPELPFRPPTHLV